jgi:outer membrane protein assembly factor BamB
MVLAGSKTVASFNPADGKRLWVLSGPTDQCVASAVYGDGLVFITGGFPELHFLAIDPKGTGDVTRTHIRWTAHKGVSYVPSPLYLEDCFYVVSDGGVISALDAKTGEYKNQKRLGGNFSASLLYAAGHIYAFNEDGEAFVLEGGPKLEVATKIPMESPIYATPAISAGRMYLRTFKKIFAIGKEIKS